MSVRPSEIRDILARAKAAKAPVSQNDPEVKARILKNREDANARKFVEGRPFTTDDLGYSPTSLRATMKGPESAEPSTATASTPAKKVVDAVRQPTRPGAEQLRAEGFDGLAELEDMQNSPLGSTSSLSGANSRRILTSPARSIERQARRYEKMGRAGAAAASDLLRTAAGIRLSEPGLRTEAGVAANRNMDRVADGLAQKALDGVGDGGNEMPPNQEDVERYSRKKRTGDYMGRDGRRQALSMSRRDPDSRY